MTAYFIQAFIYLCAAVIAVPLAKRFGLGSVLGYLIAGVVIGPLVGLVGDETVAIQHFAEFGVVMMLFLVGLELEPKSLWAMRHRLIGLGGLQVLVTGAVLIGAALALGLRWQYSVAIGLIFSLSSTAIVLQTLNEKGLTKTEGGRASFSVLLFQDIAVIPMLALIPLLAVAELSAGADHAEAGHDSLSLVAHLPGWATALVVIASIAAVVVGGHYLSRPLFRFVGQSGLREIFTATALMLVIGIAALMGLVGLSPALGTFLAGVVLANSEFRHELESSIEPFKGLLLGLFFITVGAGIDFQILFDKVGLVIGLTAFVMVVKCAILLALSYIFKIRGSGRWLFALSLAQAGEFGFVLLSFSQQNAVLPAEIADILALVVTMSMLLTPLLFIAYDRYIVPRYRKTLNEQEADDIDEQGTVIIAGIGRFGQIVNRFLVANGVKTVVLDHEVNQVENMRSINIQAFYGDATRPDLLHTAGIEDAAVLVVALDEKERAIELVHHVKQTYPRVKIVGRAYDRGHAYALRHAGADWVISETFHSALQMGGMVLNELGEHPFKTETLKATFMEAEIHSKEALYQTWLNSTEENKFNASYRDLFMELESTMGELMKRDRTDGHDLQDRSWTPPPKGYADIVEETHEEIHAHGTHPQHDNEEEPPKSAADPV